MGFRLSPASTADYPAFARLFPELEVPDSTPSEKYFAEVIAPQAIFARDGAAIVGYAWARSRGNRMHLVHLISDPAHRRRGVGRALMEAVAERSRAAGFRRWMLNVKEDNIAARTLYERQGMHVVFAAVSMRVTWADVARLTEMPGVSVRPHQIANDARFEAVLPLERGEIAAFRALPERILLGAENASGPVGFAALDPEFPGASPFRVRAPEYARALLEAMRPLTLPGCDHLKIFVEGDPRLEEALATAGAEPVQRPLRMEGELAP
jgi:ribosomal-protein-alanine N-acetyltransferase